MVRPTPQRGYREPDRGPRRSPQANAVRVAFAVALLAAAAWSAYRLPPGGADWVTNTLHIAGAAGALALATLLIWL